MTRAGRTVLIVMAALLVIVAGIGVSFLLSRAPAEPSVDEGRAVADAFLASIRDGKPDDAWQSTTAEFKSAEGREVFRKRVARAPVLKSPLEFVSMQSVDVGGQPRGEFLYRPLASDMAGKSVRLLVSREYGEWRIDRLTTE